MEGITLVFLTLLSGVVLYLVLSQRQFQRVDYSHLIAQEERERQLKARLEQAELMLRDLAEYDRQRRGEVEELIDFAGEEMAGRIAEAREQLLKDVLESPEQLDRMLLASYRIEDALEQPGQAPRPAATPAPSRPAPSPNLVRFLKSPRQREIAGMLELGCSRQEVSRTLGVSCHEVDLVGSIIFSQETA